MRGSRNPAEEFRAQRRGRAFWGGLFRGVGSAGFCRVGNVCAQKKRLGHPRKEAA